MHERALRRSDRFLPACAVAVSAWLMLAMAPLQDAGDAGNSVATDEAVAATGSEENLKAFEQRLKEVRKQLEAIDPEAPDAAERRRTTSSLAEILEATIAATKRQVEYQSMIDSAGKEHEKAEARLAAARAAKPRPVDPGFSLEQVRQGILARESALADLQQEESGIEVMLERRKGRNAQIGTDIAEVSRILAEIEAASEGGVEFRDARTLRRRIEIRALELEKRAYEATDSVLRDRLQAVILEISTQRQELGIWEDRRGTLVARDAEAKRAEAEARAAAEVESAPVLAEAAKRNSELAARFEEAVKGDRGIASQLDEASLVLDRLRRGLESDERRFSGRVSPAIAQVLRKRYNTLPGDFAIRQQLADTRSRIPSIELERILLEDELSDLVDPRRAAGELVDRAEPPIAAEDRPRVESSLAELLDERTTEFGRPLLEVLGREIDELNRLAETDRAILAKIDEYRAFLLRQTVWVRDPGALSAGFWSRVGAQLETLLSLEGWGQVARTVGANVLSRPVVAFLAFLPAFSLLVFRRRIRARIALAGDNVSRAATDHFRETLVVAAFAVLGGLALASPFWLVSFIVEEHLASSRLAVAVDHVATELAYFILAAGTLACVVSKGGLAERHFRWKPSTMRVARRLLLVTWIAVIFAIGNRICDPRELDLPDLGRLFFTPIPILISVFFLTLSRRPAEQRLLSERVGSGGAVARVVLGILAVLPLVGLALAYLGWYEAVSMFQRATIRSILFLLELLVLRELLYRGLNSRQRQATWQLRRRREEGEEADPEFDEDAIADIGTRTKAAIRFCVVSVLLLGTWVIWHELLPAFQVLRGVELWSYASTRVVSSAASTTTDVIYLPVTLVDLIAAIAIISAAFYAARNLPTVIEVVLLDRAGFERGVKYAISQLVQWILVIGGLVAGFSMLGITWSSVQWLAAGFTVGLGFGLQEIFANFISGLIILFEQPVRVGDVVTVGNTTGQISRIRMRSTTITDWDRKELVVPNKQFITSEVINWSIGESCIRLVLPVGVSYDDDPGEVAELLVQIGLGDPDTLKDPEPSASFKGFGDSSLDFELRVFLSDTSLLVPVRNRINIAIKRAFDERGITIPFPQRDCHVGMVDRSEPDRGPLVPWSGDSDSRTPGVASERRSPEADPEMNDPGDGDGDGDGEA